MTMMMLNPTSPGLDVLEIFFSVGSWVGGLVTSMMFNLPLSSALLEADEESEIPNIANATITSGTMMHNTLLWVMLVMIVPSLEGGNDGYLMGQQLCWR